MPSATLAQPEPSPSLRFLPAPDDVVHCATGFSIRNGSSLVGLECAAPVDPAQSSASAVLGGPAWEQSQSYQRCGRSRGESPQSRPESIPLTPAQVPIQP